MTLTGFSKRASNYPDAVLSVGELALQISPYAITFNFAPFLSSAVPSPGRIVPLPVLARGSTDPDDFSGIYKPSLPVMLKPVLDLFFDVVLGCGSLIFFDPHVHVQQTSRHMSQDSMNSMDSTTQVSRTGRFEQHAVRYTNVDVEMEILA